MRRVQPSCGVACLLFVVCLLVGNTRALPHERSVNLKNEFMAKRPRGDDEDFTLKMGLLCHQYADKQLTNIDLQKAWMPRCCILGDLKLNTEHTSLKKWESWHRKKASHCYHKNEIITTDSAQSGIKLANQMREEFPTPGSEGNPNGLPPTAMNRLQNFVKNTCACDGPESESRKSGDVSLFDRCPCKAQIQMCEGTGNRIVKGLLTFEGYSQNFDESNNIPVRKTRGALPIHKQWMQSEEDGYILQSHDMYIYHRTPTTENPEHLSLGLHLTLEKRTKKRGDDHQTSCKINLVQGHMCTSGGSMMDFVHYFCTAWDPDVLIFLDDDSYLEGHGQKPMLRIMYPAFKGPEYNFKSWYTSKGYEWAGTEHHGRTRSKCGQTCATAPEYARLSYNQAAKLVMQMDFTAFLSVALCKCDEHVEIRKLAVRMFLDHYGPTQHNWGDFEDAIPRCEGGPNSPSGCTYKPEDLYGMTLEVLQLFLGDSPIENMDVMHVFHAVLKKTKGCNLPRRNHQTKFVYGTLYHSVSDPSGKENNAQIACDIVMTLSGLLRVKFLDEVVESIEGSYSDTRVDIEQLSGRYPSARYIPQCGKKQERWDDLKCSVKNGERTIESYGGRVVDEFFGDNFCAQMSMGGFGSRSPNKLFRPITCVPEAAEHVRRTFFRTDSAMASKTFSELSPWIESDKLKEHDDQEWKGLQIDLSTLQKIMSPEYHALALFGRSFGDVGEFVWALDPDAIKKVQAC